MQLEICVDRVDSAAAAIAGGADRLEVCGALSLGGISPSWGLVERCVELSGGAVMMMVRPHAGGFTYADDDWGAIEADVRAAQRLGVRGVVFGALDAERRIDRELTRRFVELARPLEVTFHRAFDLAAEPERALEALIELRVDRLLTSGQAPSAYEGRELLRRLQTQAFGRLTIIAGAGVSGENAGELLAATGVSELHGSASQWDAEQFPDPLGLTERTRRTTVERVRALRNAMDQHVLTTSLSIPRAHGS